MRAIKLTVKLLVSLGIVIPLTLIALVVFGISVLFYIVASSIEGVINVICRT